MTVDLVIDHLWQSTLVASALALLTLAFRRAHAQARYAIWLAASIKFLIPFAALTSLGAQLEWGAALPQASPEWTAAIEAVRQPLTTPPVGFVLPQTIPARMAIPLAVIANAIWAIGFLTALGVWLARWRRLSRAVRAGAPIVSGRTHDTFQALASTTALPLVASDASLEPGVFGILDPVLLWPREIDLRLDDAQVRAVLAHELAHVHRRDNLTAAMHMFVEAVFWFHPMVWWIGGRLVDERERACDEHVVSLGNDPDVYAESILKTCQFFVESPLTCAAGVTGSNLKKRIERIMSNHPGGRVRGWAKAFLITAATATIAAPIGIGALTTPVRPAAMERSLRNSGRSFEVANVMPNKTGAMRVTMQVRPGGAWEATNVTLESMIRLAYRIQESQIAGGPAWIYNDRFDIVARSSQGAPGQDFGLRIQSLLAERFGLTLHRETRELPVYSLISSGSQRPRLTPSTVDCVAFARDRNGQPVPRAQPGERPTCGMTAAPGRLTGGGITMVQLAQTLARYSGRMVIDETGLSGNFDFDLEFTADQTFLGRGPGGGLPPGAPPLGATPNAAGVSIFTAVHEQLGLRLDSRRAPVDVLVIDSAEQPAVN
jgi:bla regulator protein blaR1